MTNPTLLKLCGNSDYLMLRPVTRENAGKRKNFFAAKSELLRLDKEHEITLNDGADHVIFRRSPAEDAVRIIFYWLNEHSDGTLTGRKEETEVRYSALRAFLERCTDRKTKECSILSLPDERWPRIVFYSQRNLKKVVASKMLRRKLSKFLRCAFQWPRATEIRLYDDFLPGSFLFHEHVGDKIGIEGGVVLHGYEQPKTAYYSIHT
ncbi:MAG: hypothetical protein IKR07_03770 [Oscillospiraceae bacterium]|nr:hypothetical protein [Oscillospiraceae bacterium]